MDESKATMGPFLQVRLWLAEAGPAERATTVLSAVLAVALAVWAFAPGGSDRSLPLPVSAAAPGAAPGPAATSVTVAGDPSAPNAMAPQAAEDDPTGSGAVAAADGAGGGPAASPASPPVGQSAPVAPIASDQGVTAEQVKVGFTILNLATAREAGLAGSAGIRDDTPEVIDALVADANQRGGVHGREIVAVKRNVDVLNANDQRAKCLEFARDEQVFAVVDTFNFFFRSTRACLTIEHRIPLLTVDPGSASEMDQANGLQVSPWTDQNERMREWVAAAQSSGFFDPANGFRKLGIWTDNCDRSVFDDDARGLKAYLRAAGVTEWSEFKSDCDTATIIRSGPNAVLQHRRDGVTHVFLATGNGGISGYLQAAKAQAWKPKYFASDFRGITQDVIAKDFDPDQWDRVQGVTTTRNGELAEGRPIAKRAEDCSRRLTAAGLAPITNYAGDSEALLLCEHFDLFLAAANAAPVNLTRADWSASIAGLGPWDSGWVGAARFAPGRFAGAGESAALLEWRRQCSCWHQVRGFEPL